MSGVLATSSHTPVVNAQHHNGLVAAEGCACGRETLNCHKNDQISVGPLLLTPLRDEIMNVPTWGPPRHVH